MSKKFDVLLMVSVAQMYYLNDLCEEEIAEKLHISPYLVPGILAEAVEYGIVDIRIRQFA